MAEAYVYQGNGTQALMLLNAVRDRSVPSGSSYGGRFSGDLKQAIYDERRVEFFAEGKRWGICIDEHKLLIIRRGFQLRYCTTQLTGDAYDGSTRLTPGQSALPYSNSRFVWLLPTIEVDTNPTPSGTAESRILDRM